MNALKGKVDEGVQNTQDGIAKMQKEVQDRLADTHAGTAKMQNELEAKLSQVSQKGTQPRNSGTQGPAFRNTASLTL